MADANSVQPGLATLTATGWDVKEPSEGGSFGSVGVLTASQTTAVQALVSGAGIPGSRKKGLWQGASQFQLFTTTQNYTWRMQVELAAPARWFRLGFAKSYSSTWTVDKLYVAPSSTFGSPDTPGSWVQATFSGGTATSLTVPQWTVPTGYTTLTPGDLVWSDRVYCPTIARADGGTDHLVLFSLWSNSTDTPSINNASDVGFASLSARRWKKFFMSGGDRANSTSAFTSTAQGTAPFFAIEYGTTIPTISLGVFGDSITYGLKSSLAGKGWILQARNYLLSAYPTAGIECVMSGVSGDKPIQYLNRLKLMAATGVLPDVVFFCPYSRNQYSSAPNSIAIADDAIQTIFAAGSVPVLVMGIAETSTPANNANATAVNALIPALAASWNIPYVDMTAVTPSLDADGIHPDDTMNTAMGNAAGAAVAQLVRTMLAI